MPDAGTARADFPGSDPRQLWRSIQPITALPDETRLFSGHDDRPGGREAAWESSIGEQMRSKSHLAEGIDEDGSVALRSARDRTLPLPKLRLAALQVNLQGGRLPPPEGNGRRYLEIPLDVFPRARPPAAQRDRSGHRAQGTTEAQNTTGTVVSALGLEPRTS